jgi:hypothetical protein
LRRLHKLITGAGDAADTANGASRQNGASAPAPTSGRQGAGGFRALEGGPVLLDEMSRVSIHPSEIQKLGKNLIQGLYSADGDNEDFSLMTGATRR